MFLLPPPYPHHKTGHGGVEEVWQHAKVQAPPGWILDTQGDVSKLHQELLKVKRQLGSVSRHNVTESHGRLSVYFKTPLDGIYSSGVKVNPLSLELDMNFFLNINKNVSIFFF